MRTKTMRFETYTKGARARESGATIRIDQSNLKLSFISELQEQQQAASQETSHGDGVGSFYAKPAIFG